MDSTFYGSPGVFMDSTFYGSPGVFMDSTFYGSPVVFMGPNFYGSPWSSSILLFMGLQMSSWIPPPFWQSRVSSWILFMAVQGLH